MYYIVRSDQRAQLRRETERIVPNRSDDADGATRNDFHIAWATPETRLRHADSLARLSGPSSR
jgi:hypothetical protein